MRFQEQEDARESEKRKAEDQADDVRLEGAGSEATTQPVPLDVEDLLQAPTPDTMLSSLEIGVDEDVQMTSAKANLLEAALHSVTQVFQRENVLASQRDLRNVASLLLSMGASDIGPCSQQEEYRFGARPGFAYDTQMPTAWDLSNPEGRAVSYTHLTLPTIYSV